LLPIHGPSTNEVRERGIQHVIYIYRYHEYIESLVYIGNPD
jgi:hypothetical protein